MNDWCGCDEFAKHLACTVRHARKLLSAAHSTGSLRINGKNYSPQIRGVDFPCFRGFKFEINWTDLKQQLEAPQQEEMNLVSSDFPSPLIDWITINQKNVTLDHSLNSGLFISLDTDGVTTEPIRGHVDGQSGYFIPYDKDINLIHKRYLQKGSYDTTIALRIFPLTERTFSMEFSGNAARFNNPDNLCGYNFQDTLTKVNRILDYVSTQVNMTLPHFTAGVPCLRIEGRFPIFSNYEFTEDMTEKEGLAALFSRPKSKNCKFTDELTEEERKNVFRISSSSPCHTLVPMTQEQLDEGLYPNLWANGAVVTQLHLTSNLLIGSSDDAKYYLNWLHRQTWGKHLATVFRSGVAFGLHSKYMNLKVYDKSQELRQHLSKKKEMHDYENYLFKLASYIEDSGSLRFEHELKSRFLHQKDLRFLGSLLLEQNRTAFDEIHAKSLARIVRPVDANILDNLPANIVGVYNSWRNGVPLKTLKNSKGKLLSQATLYNYRAALKKVGVDISILYSGQDLPCSTTRKLGSSSWRSIPIPDFYYRSEMDKGLHLIS